MRDADAAGGMKTRAIWKRHPHYDADARNATNRKGSHKQRAARKGRLFCLDKMILVARKTKLLP